MVKRACTTFRCLIDIKKLEQSRVFSIFSEDGFQIFSDKAQRAVDKKKNDSFPDLLDIHVSQVLHILLILLIMDYCMEGMNSALLGFQNGSE